MKKLICLAMAILMTAVLFAGCGSSSKNVKLVWGSYMVDSQEKDTVLKEFNKQLGKLLPDTTVEFKKEDLETWSLWMSSKENIDIAWTGYIFDIESEINASAFQPLDDLIKEYAPNVQNEMKEYVADYESGKYDGKQYMIPNQQAIMPQTSGLTIPAQLIKYIDVDAVRAAAAASPVSTRELYNLVDSYLDKVFASNDYDTDTIGVNIDIYDIYQALAYRGYDFIAGSRAGGALCYEAFSEDPKIMSFYETEGFKLFAEYSSKWCKKGYISEDAIVSGTDSGSRASVLGGNNSAMWYGTDNPETGESRGVVYTKEEGEIVAYNILLSGYDELFNGVSLLGSESTYLTIPYTSKNPERAMQLINLLRSPKGTEGNKLLNMLIYGFEKNSDEAKEYKTYHYTLDGDLATPVDYLSQPSRTSKYGMCRWLIGNTMLCYRTPNILEGQSEYCVDYETNIRPTLYKTKYYGFRVDMSELSIDLSNLVTAADEFAERIYYGVDKDNWNKLYDQMITKLKASNLDNVKKIVQEQADKYISEK